MRALMVRELSDDIGVLALEERDLPDPGPGEVKIRLRACAANFPDILMIQGKYQFKPALPFSPGMEGAGDVIAVGAGVEHVQPGDPVVANFRCGGFAEEVIARAADVRLMPRGLDYNQAASYRVAYLTAYVALMLRGDLQGGETLLVHGATGGVGLAAVEVGKLFDATVIGTGGSDEKLAIVTKMGADHVINYQQPDGKLGGFREQVLAITEGRGADVIYDPVGGDVFDESIRCIAWGGRLLVVGFTSGRIPSAPANLVLIKNFSVVGVRAGEIGRRDPKLGHHNIETIDRWAGDGRINPYVHAAIPLERGVEALRMLQDRKVVGKVVVTM
jgi:NADPH2:quinone reductase